MRSLGFTRRVTRRLHEPACLHSHESRPGPRSRHGSDSQGALHQRRLRAARMGSHVDAGLADGRARLRHPRARRLLHLRDRPRIDPGDPTSGWKPGRPIQRLHAPREPLARAGTWPCGDVLLPVSRLEVRHRRHAARSPRPGELSAGLRGARPAPRPLRRLGRLRVRHAERGPGAARELSGRDSGTPRSLSLRRLESHFRLHHRDRLQLEDFGRRLQRGLPPRRDPHLDARVLRRREHRLRLLRQAHADDLSRSAGEPPARGRRNGDPGHPRHVPCARGRRRQELRRRTGRSTDRLRRGDPQDGAGARGQPRRTERVADVRRLPLHGVSRTSRSIPIHSSPGCSRTGRTRPTRTRCSSTSGRC